MPDFLGVLLCSDTPPPNPPLPNDPGPEAMSGRNHKIARNCLTSCARTYATQSMMALEWVPEIRDAYFTYLCSAGRVNAILHIYHAVQNIIMKDRASTQEYSVETYLINKLKRFVVSLKLLTFNLCFYRKIYVR